MADAQPPAQPPVTPAQPSVAVPGAQAPAQPAPSQPAASGTLSMPESQPKAADAPPTVQDSVKISIILPTNAYFLSGLRDFTLSMTKNMTGFSDQWAFRFQSVVDELCNNAIEHGSAPGSEIKITYVSHPGESLEILVEDTGTGPNTYTASQMQEVLKKQKELVQTQFLGLRGRGLAKIVAEWTDEVMFEDREGGGLRIRVKKYLKGAEKENEPTSVAGSENTANIPVVPPAQMVVPAVQVNP